MILLKNDVENCEKLTYQRGCTKVEQIALKQVFPQTVVFTTKPHFHAIEIQSIWLESHCRKVSLM